jgi:GNAT superfamily N-acetyltransferase
MIDDSGHNGKVRWAVARNPVHVRDALPEDAEVLVAMWQRNTDAGTRLAEPSVDSAERSIGHLALDPGQRLLLAELDHQVVGVAHLMRTPVSPLHEETTVRVGHMLVDCEHRRRGIGRALLAEAVAWADEKQSQHLLVVVSAAAREANRFLARLGLASVATVRAARVGALQERLAKVEAAECGDGQVMVERIRILRRRRNDLSAGRAAARR